ncbi:MAG: hypothetical protein JJU12_02355 [Chlamydiales bacterium]|nr:hypothetical protein [Chlamydiales bacterium]
MDLNSLRHAAKEILAVAAIELFPGIRLIDGDIDEVGFHYTFFFPKEILTEFSERELRHLEERMIQIAHEKRPIKGLEMMRENAAVYLQHLGQPERADEALVQEANILSLIQIGEFRDLCPAPYPADTGEIKAFKLQRFESLGGNAVKVYGTAFFDKQELKKFLKQYKEAVKRDPLIIGPKEGYFLPFEGEWVYLEKGVRLLENLKDLWLKEHAGFRQIAFPDSLDPHTVHSAFPEINKIASLSLFKGDLVTIRCADSDELEEARISSLQFMEKVFKIFPFDRRVRPAPQKNPEGIAFCICDGYGRERTLSYIELERKKNVLHRSLFYSTQTWVALIVEMGVEI